MMRENEFTIEDPQDFGTMAIGGNSLIGIYDFIYTAYELGVQGKPLIINGKDHRYNLAGYIRDILEDRQKRDSRE